MPETRSIDPNKKLQDRVSELTLENLALQSKIAELKRRNSTDEEEDVVINKEIAEVFADQLMQALERR